MNPDPAPSAARRGTEILAVAAAYFATGKLALLLAIPPGYATAIWPPAGIALVAALLLGSRALPGVFLGSFLVNLLTSFERGTTGSPLAIATAIAAGAILQAHLGAGLIRRFVGAPLELLEWKEIARFLLLGGPAGCGVGATVGVATLWFAGSIRLSELHFSWWTWWVGDVIGVVVVAPLVLIAFARPREIWRRRALPVALPLTVLLILSTSLFILVETLERSRIRAEFDLRANLIERRISRQVDDSVEVLRSLESFHAASPRLTREAFRVFAEGALRRNDGFQALSWNPRVTDAERDLFERGGPDGIDGSCRITERDAKDRLVTAPRRSEYVPVRYIEPYEENMGVVGFDVSSGIVRFEAMKQANETGTEVATRKIRLMQDHEVSHGLIVFLPVYSKLMGVGGTPEERTKFLVGYFAGVVRLEDFFSIVDRRQPIDLDVQFHSADAAGRAEELLWRSQDASGTLSEIQRSKVSHYWGRPWVVVCRATSAYVADARSWKPWGVLAVGLAAAGLVGAFLLAATGRAILAERNRIQPDASGV
jgi:CHASE1-domain containing sensor protein